MGASNQQFSHTPRSADGIESVAAIATAASSPVDDAHSVGRDAHDMTVNVANIRADRVIAVLLLACAVCLGVMSVMDLRSHAEPPRRAALLDLNSAPQGEIELLPEIGPALAARIVESRRQDGPFGRVEDLDRVRGIGKVTIERVRDLVVCERESKPR